MAQQAAGATGSPLTDAFGPRSALPGITRSTRSPSEGPSPMTPRGAQAAHHPQQQQQQRQEEYQRAMMMQSPGFAGAGMGMGGVGLGVGGVGGGGSGSGGGSTYGVSPPGSAHSRTSFPGAGGLTVPSPQQQPPQNAGQGWTGAFGFTGGAFGLEGAGGGTQSPLDAGAGIEFSDIFNWS